MSPREIVAHVRYATSLRPLRPYARIIRFKKPQAQFLVKRLREICEREGLEADLRVLTQLVEMTSGDVRSCLNTLQVGVPPTFIGINLTYSLSNRNHQLSPPTYSNPPQ